MIEQAPPPHKADQDGYIYYPLTAAASMQLAAVIHAAPQFPAYWFQWANRSNAVLSNSAGKVVVRIEVAVVGLRTGALLLLKDYAAAAPASADPASVAPAMDHAVTELVARLVADIGHLTPPKLESRP